MTKDTLVAIVICVAILLSGWILSTESFIGFLLLPAVTYSAGTVLGKIKNGKWNWQDGLMWGAIGIVASILFSLAL